ncbi:MAG: hypothetical protein J0L99_04080 [Chitinophagales bacterium]|nr:hypothetical protein [Chitinophagales bacterium]
MDHFSEQGAEALGKKINFLRNISVLLVIIQLVLVGTGIYRLTQGQQATINFGIAIALAPVTMILGRNIRKLQAELEQKN